MTLIYSTAETMKVVCPWAGVPPSNGTARPTAFCLSTQAGHRSAVYSRGCFLRFEGGRGRVWHASADNSSDTSIILPTAEKGLEVAVLGMG